MAWITSAADEFHSFMKKKKSFMENELTTMTAGMSARSKKNMSRRPLGIAIFVALLTGLATYFLFNTAEKNQKMGTAQDSPEKVEIAFTDKGVDWVARYGKAVRVKTKNAGLNFYSIEPLLLQKNMVVTVKTTNLATNFSNVTILKGTEDQDRGGGMVSLFMTMQVTPDEFVSHDMTRQYVLQLVQSLRQTGWQRYIPQTDPRLTGKITLGYFNGSYIDPDYPISFEEWMLLPTSFSWKFYADHTYLKLRVQRDSDHMSPDKPGVYVISLHFDPSEEVERMEVDEDDREQWRKTWVPRATKWRTERNQAEAKLRAQGIATDTTYKDPPLPPAPQGQRNPELPEGLK
ncbi:hypothetical protein [Chitinolyticbacter albus]|uniref:hypothetical protein n=1 Tax=Chitinolyticbacter albus TaxID=2961951 RepID=UPI00210EDE0D|nr:hypothetical protein [Chitinolyticbacter albus]